MNTRTVSRFPLCIRALESDFGPEERAFKRSAPGSHAPARQALATIDASGHRHWILTTLVAAHITSLPTSVTLKRSGSRA